VYSKGLETAKITLYTLARSPLYIPSFTRTHESLERSTDLLSIERTSAISLIGTKVGFVEAMMFRKPLQA